MFLLYITVLLPVGVIKDNNNNNNHNCFPKVTDFSRFGPQQADTYTVKVAVSKKCCKIDTLLLHTTKSLSIRAISNDLEGHSPNAGLIP